MLLEAALTVGLLAVHPYLPLGQYPIVYVLAIMAVSYWLGEGPAILAFVAGLLLFDYYFVDPAGLSWPPADSPQGWARFTAFFLGTLVVGFSTIMIRRSQERARLMAHRAHDSNERTTMLLESITDAVISKGLDGRILTWNRGAESVYGYSEDEAVGRSIYMLIPPGSSEGMAELLARVAHGDKVEHYEAARIRKDGKLIHVSLSISPVRDSAGRILGASSIARDVTEVVELRSTIQRQLTLLQAALVPPAPTVNHGFNAAAVYLPAAPGQDIGGDLYDVFSTEAGQIGIVVGDVLGKGVEAASLAATARSTVHSFAYELSTPGEALMHANAVVHSQVAEKFVTVLLAVIDPRTGDLTYASAGHPPAAMWRAGGRVEFLHGSDLPMGLWAKQEYQTFKDHMDLGDKIVLYTDGVIEARRGKELFEMEGIEQFLSEHGAGTPDEVASGLLNTARDWADGRLQDDVAILVIERTSHPSHYRA